MIKELEEGIKAEVAETRFPLHSPCSIAIHYRFLHRSETRSLKEETENRGLSKIRADYIAAVFLAVIFISFGSTYASVKHRLRIEKRILRGVKKFAGWYVESAAGATFSERSLG